MASKSKKDESAAADAVAETPAEAAGKAAEAGDASAMKAAIADQVELDEAADEAAGAKAGGGAATAATDVAIKSFGSSASFPGRDAMLAATDGGKNMPGNLDAILRARHAGTQLPGDAQLMTDEEIDALKDRVIEAAGKATETRIGAGFVESDGDPNK